MVSELTIEEKFLIEYILINKSFDKILERVEDFKNKDLLTENVVKTLLNENSLTKSQINRLEKVLIYI